MFILSFLPDSFLFWVINLILVLGLAGTVSSFFIRFIPFLFPYATPIKITGIILLVLGVWFRGGYDVEMKWREKVKEVEAKVAAAEAKSQEVNTVIEKVYVDRVKVVTETKVVIKKQIVEKEKIIDSVCVVVPEAIQILNQAAKNPGASK
jgi:hypothetical protein